MTTQPTEPRIDQNGFVCLNDIHAEFGKIHRVAPFAFLQRVQPPTSDVLTIRGRYGSTWAAPYLADAYRKFLSRLAKGGKKVPSNQRRGRGGAIYSLAELAQMVGIQERTLRHDLMRHGLVYPQLSNQWETCTMLPTFPGRKFAERVDRAWRWKITVLRKIGR